MKVPELDLPSFDSLVQLDSASKVDALSNALRPSRLLAKNPV